MDGTLHLPWGYIITAAITMGGYLWAFSLVPRILLERREATVTVAWILAIIFLPYFGVVLFYVFGRTRVRRRARKKRLYHDAFQYRMGQLPLTRPSEMDAETWPVMSRTARDFVTLVDKLTENPLVSGNSVEVFIETDEAYRSMEEAILAARHHVNLMSYIFRDDATGRHFRDLLIRKASEGVSVNLLVDGFGSRKLNASFAEPLLKAGGRFAHFVPGFRRRWRPDLRNHRKILVVDGRIGFTGGLNIGEEYQGRKRRYGPWRDTHLRLEGPGVRYLQEIFIEDWLFATDEDMVDPGFFPELGAVGSDLVRVINSGPDQAHEIIYSLFFNAITSARQRIYITTPYFVPDPAMLLALKSAAWRGVDVRFLLPGKSDLWLVQLAGRSYYQELIEAGVKLYEHRPGILHAKTMVVDGFWSTVGSANMDIRSFRLNFEVNVFVWGQAFATRMEDIFTNEIKRLHPLTVYDMVRQPKSVKLAESFARVLSPLL